MSSSLAPRSWQDTLRDWLAWLVGIGSVTINRKPYKPFPSIGLECSFKEVPESPSPQNSCILSICYLCVL